MTTIGTTLTTKAISRCMYCCAKYGEAEWAWCGEPVVTSHGICDDCEETIRLAEVAIDCAKDQVFEQQRQWVKDMKRQQRANKLERVLVWAAIICGGATFWYIAFQLVRWALR